MKSLLLWIVVLLCAFHTSAQNPSTAAQPAFHLTFEKTYLHTDRDVYQRGDTLWFKAYLVNAQDNTLATSSGNLRVELISPDAKVIASELIRLEKGLGNGDFDLPDNLAAGHYRLRAYTNWMRNFGDNFVFEKEFSLLAGEGVALVVGSSSKPSATATKKTATATIAPPTQILPLIRFYPEGGSLIEGVTSIVAVKADDGFGKGIVATGAVVSSPGDTVAHFSCDSLGMGLFALLPIKGQSYRAIADLGRRRGDVFQLPSVLNKGLAIQVRQTDSLLRVIVSSSADIAAPAAKPEYTISVKHGGVAIISQPLQPAGQQTIVRIPTAGLPEGINAITLYDENKKPNCERLVYIHHPNSQTSVSISTDKKNYQPKEKVTVQLTAPPNSSLSMAVVDADLPPAQSGNIVDYLMLQSELRGNIEQAHRYFDTTNINRAKQLDLLLMTQGWRDFVWRRLADTSIRISYAAENGVSLSGNVRDEIDNKRLPNLNLNLYAGGAVGDKIFAARSDSAGKFSFTGMQLYGRQNVKLASVNEKGEKRGTFLVDSVHYLPVMPVGIKKATNEAAQDSLLLEALEKKTTDLKKVNITGVTKLKEVTIKGKGQSVMLRNGAVMMPWGQDQVFNISPTDESLMTLETYLQYYTKGAIKPLHDPNKMIAPVPPSPARQVSQAEYDQEMRLYMRQLTGVAYMGTDTFAYSSPGMNLKPQIHYRPKTKPIPPYLIVNGRELDMDSDYDQTEAYRNVYFNMPITKFKQVVLKHMTGTLHGFLPPELLSSAREAGMPTSLAPDAENIAVDRFLLYLTLKDDAMTDNPGSLSTDVDGFYQARTFYQLPASAKPSVADFRTTIHWEPYVKTDANGKASVSFYNGMGINNARVIVQGVTGNGVPLATSINYKVQ